MDEGEGVSPSLAMNIFFLLDLVHYWRLISYPDQNLKSQFCVDKRGSACTQQG